MIGQNIKMYRKAKGLTQGQLAEKVGVSKYAIFSYEKDRMEPGSANLKKLADVLGVTTNDLLSVEEDSKMRSILDWAFQRGFEKGYAAGLSDGQKEGLPFA